jgi:hypothetical protein
MKNLKLFRFALITLWLLPIPTLATPLVRKQISISQAIGSNGVNAVISVSPAQAIAISFIRTGEVVRKVWLGNPSKIVMDYDTPLCKDAAKDTNCGATVIYLRQLAQPLNIDMNLPASASGDLTSLTVVTTGSGGSRNLYQFQLVLGEFTSPYSVLEIVPDSQIRRLQPILQPKPSQSNTLLPDS